MIGSYLWSLAYDLLEHRGIQCRWCSHQIFFTALCIKQIDSMLPWVLKAMDHRIFKNVVRTSVTYSVAPHVRFHHILTSCVIYMCYWTSAWNIDVASEGVNMWLTCHELVFDHVVMICRRELILKKMVQHWCPD